MTAWKRLALTSGSFGVGFAFVVLTTWAAIAWHESRPRPWNSLALTAAFATLEIQTQPSASSYIVDFYYDLQNNTDKNYELNANGLTAMANLTDGNVLSKDFGHYQTSEPQISGPSFVPTHSKVRISLHVSYQYPPEFTERDKNDAEKVGRSLANRLKELSGFVLFDQSTRYRIELPEGWKNWSDVKSK